MTGTEFAQVVSALQKAVPDDWHGWDVGHDALQSAAARDINSIADAVNGESERDGEWPEVVSRRSGPGKLADIRKAKRGGNGQGKREPVVVEQWKVDDVLGELDQAGEPLTFASLLPGVSAEITKPQLSKCLARLVKSGTVVATGKGRGKRYHVPRRDSTPAIAGEVEIRPSTVPPPVIVRDGDISDD
jgi:hypothetical protein